MFARLGDSIRGLQEAVDALHSDAPSTAELEEIVARGNFRPAEDEAIGIWFARLLSVRLSLWEVIDEILEALNKPVLSLASDDEMRAFLVGYAAACLLIRMDRMLLFAGNSKFRERFIQFALNYALLCNLKQ